MSIEFVITHVVQFSETDMAGVVHFSNYFRWMEEVEHAFFRSRGLSVHASEKDGHISWPRVTTSCDYLAPVRFEDTVTIKLRLGRIGAKSLSYEVDFHAGPKLIAKAKLTSVCCAVTHASFTPIPIPKHIRDKLVDA